MHFISKIIILIVLAFFCEYGFSTEDGKRLEIIKKGETAEYDGFIANKKQMEHFRKINEENKLLEEKSEKQETLQRISEAEGNFYKENYQELKKENEKQQNSFWWKSIGMFLAGALSVTVFGFGALVVAGAL